MNIRTSFLALSAILFAAPAVASTQQAAEPIQEVASDPPDPAQNQPQARKPRSLVREVMRLNFRAGELLDRSAVSDGLFLFRTALRDAGQGLGADHPATIVITANYRQSLSQRVEDLFEKQSNREIKDFTEIRPLLNEIRRIDEEFPARREPGSIDVIYDRGVNIATQGNLTEAKRLLRDAAQLSQKVRGEAHPKTLAAIGEYAFVLSQLGEDLSAIELNEDVLRQRQTTLGGRHPDTLLSLSYYAYSLRGLRRYAEAAEVDAEVLRIRKEVLGPTHERTLASMNNLASDLRALGRLEEALVLNEDALRTQIEKLGDVHPDTLAGLSTRAAILSDLERHDESAKIFEALYSYWLGRLGEEHPNTMRASSEYGSALFKMGRLEEAKTLIGQTRRHYVRTLGSEHPETLAQNLNYAEILLDLGETDEARGTADYLLQAFGRRVGAQSISGLRGAFQTDQEASMFQYAQKFYADAVWESKLKLPDQFLSSYLEKNGFWALQSGSKGLASQAVAKAAASRFAQGAGLQELVQEREALSTEWSRLSSQFARSQVQSAVSSEQRAGLDARIQAIEGRIGAIEKQLRQEAPQYFSIVREGSNSADEIREVLGADEAVLFLVPTKRGTHVVALTLENFRWTRSELTEARIGEAVEELRLGLEIQAGDAFLPYFDLELAHSLYVDLIEPVQDVFEGKKRLYVVADGSLTRLPLGTLLTEPMPADADADDPEVLRSADWLADRYALVQLPSVQSLIYIRSYGIENKDNGEAGFTGFGAPVLEGEARLRGARSATLDAIDAASLLGEFRGSSGLALMNPDALRKLAALPGTRSELEQVQEALGAPRDALYLADRMTETSIRSADLSKARILHLATHGFTSEESGAAAEPGLVFTPPQEASAQDDGYLAASEVLALDLTMAEWIIMSACNTASPSGRPGETGLSGLAQAFFYAGAGSLLVSHWPVFDDIAPLLTVEALKRSEAGQPRAEALQAAMRKIRMDPELDAAHPAVWAPFTLVGEGR